MRKISILALLVLFGMSANAGVPLAGVWHGILKVGQQQLSLVLHISDDEPPVVTLDSPDQNAKGIPAELAFISADSIALHIPQLGVNYSAGAREDKLIGTFSQMGFNLPLTLERGQLLRDRPQTPHPPFDYDTREVRFQSLEKGVTLAGTLTLPRKAPNSTPVIIMVTGSGSQNRDEELFDHKPFAVIADWLANNGIASLRYDDRGVGGSVGNPDNATTSDLAKDAEGAIRFLRNEGYTNIGVYGHSEGGTIAFMTAATDEPTLGPNFIITVGAPALNGKEILVDQLHTTYPNATEEERQMLLNQAATQAGKWMRFFLDFDPATVISKVKGLPMLIIYGANDTQVRPAINEPVMHQLLDVNPDCKIVVMDGLNHLLQPSVTGMATEYSTISTTIAPEALDLITEFINAQR
ncbi:MAG: lysophospholipase [Muribaculaceae bacterium]|nr:lysophospholipase [Muribaculaceae bacterium]